MVEDTRHYSALRAATVGLAIPNRRPRYIVEEIARLIPGPGRRRSATQRSSLNLLVDLSSFSDLISGTLIQGPYFRPAEFLEAGFLGRT